MGNRKIAARERNKNIESGIFGRQRKKMVGLGRVVISRRERIVMVEPLDKGLIATTHAICV
jgi:hypothetical protein